MGHIPKSFSNICYQFLFLAGCTAEAKDTAKRVDKSGGYGLGILVCYNFFGSEKVMDWFKIEKDWTEIFEYD